MSGDLAIDLSIMAALREVSGAEMKTVAEWADVDPGRLKERVDALSDVGCVRMSENRRRGRPQTWLSLTVVGEIAMAYRLAELRALAREAP